MKDDTYVDDVKYGSNIKENHSSVSHGINGLKILKK